MLSARLSSLCIIAFCSGLLGCVGVPGDGDDQRRLTLDGLHGSGDFDTEGFGPVRWLEDGTGYTSLERAEGGGREIILYRPETGSREVLVSAAAMTPEGRERPLGIADYIWSEDATKLLIFTNTRRVWRSNSRGDYWVLDRDAGTLSQLGADLDATHLQFAKFSPDGDRVAFVYRNDIYVEVLDGGERTRLTRDGSETVVNGTFDWVYEEEWGLRDGFRWSPDGRSIAYWQIDGSGVKEFTLIDNTSGLYPTLKKFPYPKVGEMNPACRVGVVSATAGETRWMKIDDDPRDNYIARMEWAASSDEIVMQHVNRLQNTIRVLFGNAADGTVDELLVEEEEAWAEVCDDLVWIDDGQRFTWVSERSGWRHVYLVNRNGRAVQAVTWGPFDVDRIVHVDDEGGWIYFIASPENPTQRYLYRAQLRGGIGAERLTPEGARGTHGYQISRDARWAIHTYSRFGVPPVIDLVSLPQHESKHTFVDNADVRERLASLDGGRESFLRVPVDDEDPSVEEPAVTVEENGNLSVVLGDSAPVELDGWVIFPPNFDRRKKYPLLVYVYGEPAGTTVRDSWGGGTYLWHRLLAQQGIIVVSFDNRGTPSLRGRGWRKSIYRQIGILAAIDQAAALRSLQDRWRFIDRDRVAIWGWSGGGSMSLNAIFRYPDLYQTAIAIAFVANQRYYDTIYQERYMGLPDDNVEGFRDGSPITHAKNLEGNLLLVYGTGDDNCHYQNCEALVNELIAHDKAFSMMAYPNRSHGIHEGENTRRHLYGMMLRYLLEHLRPGT